MWKRWAKRLNHCYLDSQLMHCEMSCNHALHTTFDKSLYYFSGTGNLILLVIVY